MWLKKQDQIIIGVLNIGSMTGKGRDVMVRRTENLCAGNSMESYWKVSRAREFVSGYKLLINGANSAGRNSVGIILSKDFMICLVSVNRSKDQIMGMKLCLGEVFHIVTAYTPQFR